MNHSTGRHQSLNERQEKVLFRESNNMEYYEGLPDV